MGKLAMDRSNSTLVEAILKDDLARGDRALRSVAPVISHLLDNSGPALVTDAIVARLRGMLTDIASQLLQACEPEHLASAKAQADIDQLADALTSESAVLDHLHTIALEGYLTERLERQASLDPVLSPMLQELIASDQPSTAGLAMKVLAAQSRFMQSQQRMGFAIGELPPELFLTVLSAAKHSSVIGKIDGAKRAIKALRKRYDEGTGRLGLLARLMSSLKGGAVAGLNLEHAGLAMFVSALAGLAKQPRDLMVLSCHEHQTARLALALRAAGLEEAAIESQFVLLGPVERLPRGIAEIPPERARDLLCAGGAS